MTGLFRKIIILLAALSAVTGVYGQDQLIGAKDLLKNISDKYAAGVKDFQADIKWVQEEKSQGGKITFKNPQKMRIDFDDPRGQVICTNGYEFWVYIEYMNIVLHQDIMSKEKKKDDNGKVVVVDSPIMINPVGYDKFLKDYAVEYQDAKSLIDYTDGSKVYKFKLIRWRSSQNGFNVIYLTVQPDGLARKIEGITAAYKKVVLELDNYKLNQNIPDLRFEYEPPAHANVVENFISKQGDN